MSLVFFFFQAEDGIRDYKVTGVQTCALPISTGRPGQEPGFPGRSSGASLENPLFQSPQEKTSVCALRQPVPVSLCSSQAWDGCGWRGSTGQYEMGFKTDRVFEYASSGTGETTPIPLGHYRLPLRCQTIMIVNLPISGSSTSNLIIEFLLSASKRRPGR